LRLRAFAALLAAAAVGLGAFGAHALRDRFLAEPRAGAWWETATVYLLVHALAGACLPPAIRRPRILLLAGAAVFSGTLYAMALGAPRWLGAVTPLGGTLMIVGWIATAVAFVRDEEMKGLKG